MGAGSTIMDLEDFLVSSNLLPLGSMVFVMFCMKKNGWGWNSFLQEVNTGAGRAFPGAVVLRLYMTYILPLIIVVVYLKGYYDIFKEKGTISLIGWMTFAVALLVGIIVVMWKRPKE